MPEKIYTFALGVFSLCVVHQTYGQCTEHAKPSEYDRKLIVGAAYGHDAKVSMEFLAAKACEGRLEPALRGLGAKILYSDDKVGYALVSLPREKVFDALDIGGVEYAHLGRIHSDDHSILLPERKVIPVLPFTIPFPRVATSLTSDGPYFPAEETGLTALWAQHPMADGRGVRVGLPDVGFDLLHPELLEGRDADGNLVPKVVDLDMLSTPETDDSWVQFGGRTKSDHGVLHAQGRDWRVPEDGHYRFGVYDHTLTLGRDFDDEHKAPKVELSAGVLWSEEKGLIWVDADGDGDFANDQPLADYAVNHDVSWFGTKEGANDNRIPFGVKIDPKQGAAFISIGGFHGAFIGGALAGNRLTGGLFDGAAPSAQMIDVRASTAKLPPILRAFARNDVDIVNFSGGVARVLDHDREAFERHVLERALAVYGKPFACYCSLPGALFVLDYQSPEMLRRNRQLAPPYLDAMNSFVDFTDDGLVNTVLEPSTALLAESRYVGLAPWPDGKRHVSVEELDPPAPDGYAIGSNPSPTIVVASGVLADLVSEARQEHVRYDSERLTNAIFTSSKQVPGFPAGQQGHGLVNAAGAWAQLVKMAQTDDSTSPVLTSFKVAQEQNGKREVLRGFRADVDQAGKSIDGELWIERVGGYRGSRSYRLALRANDGTYVLKHNKVNFNRDVSTKVRFAAKVGPGFHVAFLQLIDKKTDTIMQEIPLSVRAPEIPKVLEPGVEKYQESVPPLHSIRPVVYVGDEVQAARYNLRIPYAGPPSFVSTCSIPGFNCRGTKSPEGEWVDPTHHVGPMIEAESLVANTTPGAQQLFLENYGRPDYGTSYYGPAPDVAIAGTVTVTKYAVGLAREGQKLTATNRLAEIDGRVELFDAKIANSREKGSGPHAWVEAKRTLPEYLSQWRVAVSSDLLAENAADAYLLNCTDPNNGCFVAAQKALGKGGAIIEVDQPKEGDWRIVIRTRNKADKEIAYHLREATLTPSATPIEIADGKHSSGSAWSVALPAKQSDAQYAAFHIAGHAGKEGTQNDGAKNGLRIALTPLDTNAP